MTIDREAAAALLADIARTERRTFTSIFDGIASPILLLWGMTTVAGNVLTQWRPELAGLAWPALDVAGLLGTVAILRARARGLTREGQVLGWQLLGAELALIGFGALALLVLGPFSGRQLSAFWPLLFMLGYVLAGIWVGRFFILCGAAVAVLTIAGYWWSGPWFPLWQAAGNGGGLILGALWLQHRGAAVRMPR